MTDTFLKDRVNLVLGKEQLEAFEEMIGALNEVLEVVYGCQISYDTTDVPDLVADLVRVNGLQVSTHNYENKRVKIKGQDMYGKVIHEYSSEVLVAIEVSNETSDNEGYFKKSEVEIVEEDKNDT